MDLCGLGAYHGILLILNRWLDIETKVAKAGTSGRLAFCAATFLCMSIGWIPFRCASLHDTVLFFRAIGGPAGALNASLLAATLAVCLGAFLIDALSARYERDDFPRLLPIYVLIPTALAATIFIFPHPTLEPQPRAAIHLLPILDTITDPSPSKL